MGEGKGKRIREILVEGDGMWENHTRE